MQTYATDTYTNAVPSAVEDSAAAGAVATQELSFSFQKVALQSGGNMAVDDWLAPAA